MSDLKHGDAVKVWPMPGKRVQRHPETFGQFMAADGEDVQFSDWIHDRLMDGSVSLHDPRPAPPAEAPAAYVEMVKEVLARDEAAHAAPAKKDGDE